MALLLDTVALVLWWGGAPHLGERAREALSDGSTTTYLSAVSVWEIANRNRVGKLPQLDGFEQRLPELLDRDSFTLLPIVPAHALRGGYLPGAHRDPFDRLLAGQALVENLTVLTNDPEIAAFGCKVLW